jgi:hypothetical protein
MIKEIHLTVSNCGFRVAHWKRDGLLQFEMNSEE